MSVQALSWVLESSEAVGGPRLVLLSIANHASHDGTSAWPAIPTIAKESRLSEREVYYAIKFLEQLGELAIEHGGGRGNANLYSLPKYMQDLQCLRERVQSRTETLQNDALNPEPSAPEPSLTIIEPSSNNGELKFPKPRKRTKGRWTNRLDRRDSPPPGQYVNYAAMRREEEEKAERDKHECIDRAANQYLARVGRSAQSQGNGKGD